MILAVASGLRKESMDTKKTILLVEDEPVTAFLQSELLQKRGYNVMVAQTGEEGVEMACKHPHINLVLMDIELGAGIDGTESACQILKKRDVPVIFLSSRTETEILEKAKQISPYGYFIKGLYTHVLFAYIEEALKLHEAGILQREYGK